MKTVLLWLALLAIFVALYARGQIANDGDAPDIDPLFKGLFALLAVLVAFVYFARRQAAKGGGNASIMGMRKSKARDLAAPNRLRFTDIGGVPAAKEQLHDLVRYLMDPGAWAKIGARPVRGVLLQGPPGCGKSMLARAVAGEAGRPFLVVSGSEFVELLIGVGAARVRDTFETAKKQAPSVIFIDEIDALGRRRGSGIGLANDEREQTLNQLLVCMDGVEAYPGVVVLAASNRADVLDPALMRPGRFDRVIDVALPDEGQRLAILKIHAAAKGLAADVSLEALAARTDGLSGADLEGLCNEAVTLALRGNAQPLVVGAAHIEQALAAITARGAGFDAFDRVAIESGSQLVSAAPGVEVYVKMVDGSGVEGRLVWADARFLRILAGAEQRPVIVNKAHVLLMEPRGAVLTGGPAPRPDQWNYQPRGLG